MRTQSNQAGFSLLELILVIVLLGVLASGAGLLITTPIQAYSDQLRRQQLVDQAEMALRQIARDIRSALPNSIRIQNVGAAGWALEMTNSVDGARYRDEAGGAFTTADDILDFSSADENFNLLGNFNRAAPAAPGTVSLTDLRLVIYNTASPDFYTSVTAGAGVVTPLTSALTLSQNGVEQRINISSPGFQFSQQSPGQRVFLIDGPISYICDPLTGQTKMTRYTNYPFQSSQPTTDTVLSGLSGVLQGNVATQLSACTITYNPGATQRGGIVTLSLTLSDATGERVTLLHQVHVVNVP